MNVIILGENHNNTLSLLRSLGEEGHYIVLLLHTMKYNYAHKSKYVKKYIFVEQKDDIIKIIKETAVTLSSKPALFTSDDHDAALIEDNRQELSNFCFCEGGCSENNINCYRNKDFSNKLAEELGFLIPKNIVLDNPEGFTLQQIQFPVMLKANNSIHGGKEVQEICNDKDTLIRTLKRLPKNSYPVQVQEFIDKEYEIMLQGCSCNGGNTIYCEVANRRIRVYPFIYGGCSYGRGIEIETDENLKELRSKVIEYLRRVGYSGQFSAEFLYYRGKYYFLEVNLRNDGTSYLSTKCGFNLPHFYCQNLVSEALTLQIDSCFKETYYMNAIFDVHYVIARKLSFFTWIRQVLGSKCHSHFNVRDMRPYLYYINSIIRILVNR